MSTAWDDSDVSLSDCELAEGEVTPVELDTAGLEGGRGDGAVGEGREDDFYSDEEAVAQEVPKPMQEGDESVNKSREAKQLRGRGSGGFLISDLLSKDATSNNIDNTMRHQSNPGKNEEHIYPI